MFVCILISHFLSLVIFFLINNVLSVLECCFVTFHVPFDSIRFEAMFSFHLKILPMFGRLCLLTSLFANGDILRGLFHSNVENYIFEDTIVQHTVPTHTQTHERIHTERDTLEVHMYMKPSTQLDLIFVHCKYSIDSKMHATKKTLYRWLAWSRPSLSSSLLFRPKPNKKRITARVSYNGYSV